MEINVADFIAIPIVGVILSLAVEAIKGKFETRPKTTKFLTLVLALVIAGVYAWVRSTSYWPAIVGILGAASAFYAFFLK